MRKSFVKNREALEVTPARIDALAILEAGLQAVKTGTVIKEQVTLKDGILSVKDVKIDLDRYERVLLIGFGKASGEAALAMEELLGDRIKDGVIIATALGKLRFTRGFIGTHPLPTEANIEATKEIIELLATTTLNDLVICLVSGGGSALLCDPYEATCNDFASITSSLLKSGASIQEINTVRKHLSRVHGGQLALHASPARVLSLIFSDVPTNDLSMIASGPTVLDTTTIADATKILEHYAILSLCKLPACHLTETPKDVAIFDHVENVLICSNERATEAMKKEAKKRGYHASVITNELSGEAREAATHLTKNIKKGEAHLYGGELSVSVQGNAGIGGRNQEATLAALLTIPDDVLFLACASDGIDNSLAAGAIADAVTKKHIAQYRLSISDSLHEHNSYPFFQHSGDAIQTGITGINISDLIIVLREK